MNNFIQANKGKNFFFLFASFFFIFGILTFSLVSADNFPTDDVGVVVYSGINLTNFTQLSDTPSTYSGQAGLLARVNAGENALEFINLGTLYYPVSSNPLVYWNSTFAIFNKTYADTLYYDIDNNVLTYWNSTFATFNKTYGDTLYNPLGIISNSTAWNRSGTNVFLTNSGDSVGIGTSSPSHELNVIGDGNFTGNIYGTNVYASILNASGTSNLDNTNFNGGWASGGVTIEDGNIYAQTLYVWNITSLNVQTVAMNGSLVPTINNTFNLGNETLYWNNLYLGGTLYGAWNGSSGYIPYTGSSANVVLGAYNFTINTDKFFVNANTGNVGIGTTSPSTKLHVEGGTLRVDSGGATTDYMEITDIQLKSTRSGSSAGMEIETLGSYTGTGGYIDFNPKNVFAMRIAYDGNVGIGTTLPFKKLHVFSNNDGVDEASSTFVVGNSTTNSDYLFVGVNQANNYSYIGSVKAGIVYNPLVLQPVGGNVGIGTTSPGVLLDVVGTTPIVRVMSDANYNDSELRLQLDSSKTTQAFVLRFDSSGGVGYIENWYNNTNGDIRFRTRTLGTPVDALTIEGDGNVGIGTTTPQNKLNVVGDGNFTIGLIIGSPSSSINITMYSPDGTAYSCGVQDGGTFACV